MNSERDPFGFRRGVTARPTGGSIIFVRPGQELRIIVGDSSSDALGFGDASPSRSGDASPSRSGDASPSRSGDASPSRSGDASPSRSGDASPSRSGDFSQDAFGFRSYRRAYSPTPMTIVAMPGQEIRIVVPDERGQVTGFGDASPSRSGDGR